jgi:hypothetical protein
MDGALLSVEAPREPRPEAVGWCVAHIVYNDGPVVAVLWWDDRPLSYLPFDEDGVVGPEKVVEAPERGWCYWLLGRTMPYPRDPRQEVAAVITLGAEPSPTEALDAVLEDLEALSAPTWDYGTSLEMMVERLWGRDEDPENDEAFAAVEGGG